MQSGEKSTEESKNKKRKRHIINRNLTLLCFVAGRAWPSDFTLRTSKIQLVILPPPTAIHSSINSTREFCVISEYPRLTSLSFLTTCLQDNASRRGFLRLSRVLPTSRVFTSDYVNTETILHFFKIEYDNRQKTDEKNID